MLVAYLQGQASPAGRTHGPDKSPDFYGWCGGAGVSPRPGKTAQLLGGVSGLDELPHCCCVCESTAKDIVTTVCVLSRAPPLGRRFISNVDLVDFPRRNFAPQGQFEVIKPVTAQ